MHSLCQFLPRLDVPLEHVYIKISAMGKYDGWLSNQRQLCRDNPHKTVHRLLTYIKSMKTVHRSSSNSTCKILTWGPELIPHVNLFQPLGCSPEYARKLFWPLWIELGVCVCVSVCVCTCVAMMHIWKSENNVWESQGSNSGVQPWKQTSYLLSHLASPGLRGGWTNSSSISDSSLWTMHMVFGVFCICTTFPLPLHASLHYSSFFPYLCPFLPSFILFSPLPPPSSISLLHPFKQHTAKYFCSYLHSKTHLSHFT